MFMSALFDTLTDSDLSLKLWAALAEQRCASATVRLGQTDAPLPTSGRRNQGALTSGLAV